MNFRRYLVIFSVLMAVFAVAGVASAQVGANNKEPRERVIAHTKEEIIHAKALGCSVARKTRNLTALRCPKGVVVSLLLMEDIRVFALDEEESDDEIFLNRRELNNQSIDANKQIGADKVHAAGNTGSGAKVAVLDTGYNYNHQELSSSYGGGKDFVNDDDDPMDDNGHGSHVSGIITADGIDPKAKGVAPDAQIIAGKVLDETGSGYFSDVVAGIYWAVDGPDGVYGTGDDFNIDAINLSLGTGAPYLYKGFCDGVLPDLTNAVKYATEKNAIVAVAAGNSGNAGVSLPGCVSYSTTVGAVNSSDKIASFSGRGKALDIVAPGVSVYSAFLGNSYAAWSGTSMATPMISAVSALVKYAHPSYTQSQLENKLFTTAKDLGKIGKDANYGWGRVDAFKAVQ